MRVIIYGIIILAVLLVLWLVFRKKKPTTFPVVSEVNLSKYQGKWYEIARLPTPFEKGCTNATAYYSLNQNGTMNITNSCLIGNKMIEANGVASPNNSKLDPATTILKPATLSVKFDNSPIVGEYNILYLDQNYQYAMVGTKDYKYLWLLARTPTIADNIYKSMVDYAKFIGFPVNKLVKN